MLGEFSKVYNLLEDDISKDIYLKRLNFLISKDKRYMVEISKKYCPDIASHWKGYSVWGEIGEAELVVYGAGEDGNSFLAVEGKENLDKLNILYFCDASEEKQREGFHGYQVISPEQLFDNYDGEKILITSSIYEGEIKNNCIAGGIPKENIYVYSEYGYCYSKKQYFYEDFLVYHDKEVFVDAGSKDLNTSVEFKKICPNAKSYAFEPDPYNYAYCEKRMEKEKIDYIKLLPFGTWSSRTTLNFSSTSNGCSHITEDDGEAINVITIDEAVSETVTFIKMDVEGAELESLKGAKKIIQRDRPKLAISLYHKEEDMTEIPLYIKGIVPDYKIYIRHYSMQGNETVLYAVP